MPFAFSTLGCPDAGLDEVVALARSVGAAGVELRAGGGHLVHAGMPPAARRAARAAFEDAGVEVLTVASSVRVCDPGPDDELVRDLLAHVDLAVALGCGRVRVFPGRDGPGAEGDARAVRRLRAAAATVAGSGSRVLVETHDSHPRGRDVAPILAALDESVPGHPFGVIWDTMHPWRAGEAPAATYAAVRPWLDYVQFKDARLSGALTRIGAGDVPLADVAGWVPAGTWWSFEWEKAWLPELPDLGDVIHGARDWWHAVADRPPGTPS